MNSVTASHDATVVPLVEEIEAAPDPVEVFRRLCHLPHCLFLDSAARSSLLGQYSFVSADPFAFVRVPADGSDGLRILEPHCTKWHCAKIENLPPFQGGAAGIFSYDLGLSFERLPRPRFDEFGVPAVAMGLYDFVVAFEAEDEVFAVSADDQSAIDQPDAGDRSSCGFWATPPSSSVTVT